MHYTNEQARTQTISAPLLISRSFGKLAGNGVLDAEFFQIAQRNGLDDVDFVKGLAGLFVQGVEIRIHKGAQKIALAVLQDLDHALNLVSDV